MVHRVGCLVIGSAAQRRHRILGRHAGGAGVVHHHLAPVHVGQRQRRAARLVATRGVVDRQALGKQGAKLERIGTRVRTCMALDHQEVVGASGDVDIEPAFGAVAGQLGTGRDRPGEHRDRGVPAGCRDAGADGRVHSCDKAIHSVWRRRDRAAGHDHAVVVRGDHARRGVPACNADLFLGVHIAHIERAGLIGVVVGSGIQRHDVARQRGKQCDHGVKPADASHVEQKVGVLVDAEGECRVSGRIVRATPETRVVRSQRSSAPTSAVKLVGGAAHIADGQARQRIVAGHSRGDLYIRWRTVMQRDCRAKARTLRVETHASGLAEVEREDRVLGRRIGVAAHHQGPVVRVDL